MNISLNFRSSSSEISTLQMWFSFQGTKFKISTGIKLYVKYLNKKTNHLSKKLDSKIIEEIERQKEVIREAAVRANRENINVKNSKFWNDALLCRDSVHCRDSVKNGKTKKIENNFDCWDEVLKRKLTTVTTKTSRYSYENVVNKLKKHIDNVKISVIEKNEDIKN